MRPNDPAGFLFFRRLFERVHGRKKKKRKGSTVKNALHPDLNIRDISPLTTGIYCQGWIFIYLFFAAGYANPILLKFDIIIHIYMRTRARNRRAIECLYSSGRLRNGGATQTRARFRAKLMRLNARTPSIIYSPGDPTGRRRMRNLNASARSCRDTRYV